MAHRSVDARRTRQDKDCSRALDKVSSRQGQEGQDQTRSVLEPWTRCPVDKDKKDKTRQGVSLSLVQGVHPTRTRQGVFLSPVQGVQSTRTRRTRQDKECS